MKKELNLVYQFPKFGGESRKADLRLREREREREREKKKRER